MDPFGMKVEPCGALPPGFFALRRNGHVVEHGRVSDLANRYRPGDSVLIARELYTALNAEKPAAPREDSGQVREET
jgi:hypothetical protein